MQDLNKSLEEHPNIFKLKYLNSPIKNSKSDKFLLNIR